MKSVAPRSRERARSASVRAIGGQIEGARGAGEALLPVGELAIEGVAGEPGALPGRVVCVLHREIGERRRQATGERVVERGELAGDDADAPGVGDDVVHRDEEDVLALAQLEEAGADHRASTEIEGAARLRADLGARRGFALDLGEVTQADDVEAKIGIGGDHGRGAPLGDGVAGAQDGVAANDLAQRALQHVGVEVAGEAQRERDDIRRVVGRELVEEPLALLGEGEDTRRVRGLRGDRCGGAPAVPERVDHTGREISGS
jgi:hypothetical protein